MITERYQLSEKAIRRRKIISTVNDVIIGAAGVGVILIMYVITGLLLRALGVG